MPRWGGRRGRPPGEVRRSGPPGEERWWVPADQVEVERPLLHRTDLGRRWAPAPMLNNAERLDPLGDDPASAHIRAARVARRLTALDEGQALRRRDRVLVVLRVERFADDEAGPGAGDPAPPAADPGVAGGTPPERHADGLAARHRKLWRAHAEAALDATWRQRWEERELPAGWIEARWVEVGERPAALRASGHAGEPDAVAGLVDWVRIEDHTDPTGHRGVHLYEHLSIWADPTLVTLTARHPLEVDAADQVAEAAVLVAGRLLARRDR